MKLFKTLATSFESFDQTIRTYLIKTLGAAGEKYSKSQIFSIIFEGIKGVMQNVMFYIEDAFTEQNIETAYRKTSIYSLAKLSGYEPFYGSAATGIVDLSVPLTGHLQNNSTKIYIRNKSTLLNNSNGLYYSVEIPTDFYVIDITKPLSKYQLKVVQGVWKTATYSSFGDPLEAIHVSTSGMYDNEYISVTVDGQEYTRVYNLYDMSENGLEYFVNVGYDNEFDVIFGNGIYGKQLNENQIVIISYLSHTGVEGNINVDDNIDFVFQTTIFDDNGDSIDTQKILKFALSTPISGGSNSETIDVVRNMVGYNSRSLVLANENNFRLFFRRFSFVGQTNIWCEKNSLVVNAVCLSNYKHEKISYTDYFKAYSDGKLLLTKAQKDMIITTLNNSNKTFAGVTLNFIDPIIYKYGILAYIKIDPKYDKDVVRDEISKLIASYFINLKPNTTFIPKSDIIHIVVSNLPYIESFDFSFISDIDECGKKLGYYYTYVKTDNTYEKIKMQYSKTLGLDILGNISISDKFAIPILSNEISFFINDASGLSNNLSNLPAIQFLFI